MLMKKIDLVLILVVLMLTGLPSVSSAQTGDKLAVAPPQKTTPKKPNNP